MSSSERVEFSDSSGNEFLEISTGLVLILQV